MPGPLSLPSYHLTHLFMQFAGVALAGILAVLHSCLDLGATLGGSTQHHYIFYFLATAMKPRMLMTVDEELNLLTVPVRVGQAVDVVAQVGSPACQPKQGTGGAAGHAAGASLLGGTAGGGPGCPAGVRQTGIWEEDRTLQEPDTATAVYLCGHARQIHNHGCPLSLGLTIHHSSPAGQVAWRHPTHTIPIDFRQS